MYVTIIHFYNLIFESVKEIVKRNASHGRSSEYLDKIDIVCDYGLKLNTFLFFCDVVRLLFKLHHLMRLSCNAFYTV